MVKGKNIHFFICPLNSGYILQASQIRRTAQMNDIPESFKSNNKRLLLNSLGAAVVFGAIEGTIGVGERTPGLLQFSEGLIFSFILFYWFMVDSTIRDYNPSRVLKFMVVVFAVIALPWYIIRTRGLRQSVTSFVCALGLLVLSDGALLIVTMLISGLTGHGFVPPDW
jgi:hypothetical protein